MTQAPGNSSSARDPTDVEVLIVGGGPVGLASAVGLGRAGIRTLVLERRRTFSRHSKAAGIHARTMEIYRQWGIADLIRERGGGSSGVFTAAWMTRLAAPELGSLTVGADAAERELLRDWSPEWMALCGQDTYEPILAETAQRLASVQVRLGAEVTAVVESEGGVMTTFVSDGVERKVKSLYVIAADGVRSPVRRWLGIGEEATPSFGDSINVLFTAPLEPWRAQRRHGLFWVINAETQGALSWKRRDDLWSYNFEAGVGEEPASYTTDRCIHLIRAATGVPTLPVNVLSTLHWQHDQSVTQTWRAGRVFLAGDAAHRFPPHGGFGMNSGVQDSFNLTWKLVARLRWGAGDRLLDTFQDERQPVARLNAEQCVINTRRMAETGWLLKDPRVLADIEKPEGAALRQKIVDAIPKQREQFFSHGQQFGYIYRSAAVLDDGSEPERSTISEYRPGAHPGARAPHVWLQDSRGGEFSSIDLYSGGFILFTGVAGTAWMAAARDASATTRVPLKASRIGAEGMRERAGKPRWTQLCGVNEEGAVLIRPDGHVASRWTSLPDRPGGALSDAIRKVLSREP